MSAVAIAVQAALDNNDLRVLLGGPDDPIRIEAAPVTPTTVAPYISVTMIVQEQGYHLLGANRHWKALVEYEIIATSLAEADAIADLVHEALDDLHGDVLGYTATFFSGADRRFYDDRTASQPGGSGVDQPMHRRCLEYTLHYRRNA